MNSWGLRVLRLVDTAQRADTAPRPLAIVAPPGFGLRSVRALLERHRPDLHVVDQISPNDLAGQIVPNTVLVSRSMPATIGFCAITHEQLSYTKQEARAVAEDSGVGPDTADALLIMTGGWARYFELCVEAAANGKVTAANEAVDRLRTGPHLDDLVQMCTSGLSAKDREVARIACSLGQTTALLLEELGGPGVVERLQNNGLPLVSTGSGQFAVLAPIDEYLAGRGILDESTAAEIGAVLGASAGSLQAARILLQAGSPNAASRLIESLSLAEVDEASQELLEATLTTLLDVEKDDGSLSLLLARVHQNQGKLDLQRSRLVIASRTARDQLRLDVAVEADAELLMLDLSDISPEDALHRHEELQKQAEGHSNERTLIRLREVSEALRIQSYDLTSISRSVLRVEATAAQWEAIGENARAASTLRMLVSTSITHLGRYAYGAELMRKARTLTKNSPQALLKSFSLLTRMNALAADLPEFEQSALATRELSKSVGFPWIDGYLAWSEMIVAGHRGDLGDVELLMRRATTLLDSVGLMDHATGLVFTCEAARAFAQCGELDQARALLRSVENRASQERLEFELASFLVSCRTSPADGDDLVARLRSAASVPNERQWTVDLETAIASGRPTAADTLELARKDAASHGLTGLFDILARSASDAQAVSPVRICVLGAFQVTKDGQTVALKSEKAIQLLSFLAVRSKPVPNEVLVDHLWPGATVSVGARRLRNVVRRAREAIGTDGLLRSPEALALGPQIQVDLSLLDQLLGKVEACPEESSEPVVAAIDLYRGPLLEQLVYEDWVSVSRLDVGNRFVEALRAAVRARGIAPSVALRAIRQIDTSDPLLLDEAMGLAESQSDYATMRALESHRDRSSLGRQPLG